MQPNAAHQLEYVKAVVARFVKAEPSEIESYRFAAEPGGAYSEYTEWDFSCDVIVTLTNGEERRGYMSESDVVEFLNGWPT